MRGFGIWIYTNVVWRIVLYKKKAPPPAISLSRSPGDCALSGD